jgi:hypothetical protein
MGVLEGRVLWEVFGPEWQEITGAAGCCGKCLGRSGRRLLAQQGAVGSVWAGVAGDY